MFYNYPTTTLELFQRFLNDTDTTAANVEFFNTLLDVASDIVEVYLGYKVRGRTYTNEEYSGLDQKYVHAEIGRLYTKGYPIQSITSLYDDVNRDFGADTLIDSSDYYISDNKRYVQLWDNESVFIKTHIQNIRITYVAGYDDFEIVSGVNDKIDFEETTSTELTATLSAGSYTNTTLGTEIKTQLEVAGASTYTITYNLRTGKFKLASDRAGGGGTFKILWSTGTNATTSVGGTLGFDTTADDTDAASHTSDYSRLGLPEAIIQATNIIGAYLHERSSRGNIGVGVESKILPQGGGTIKHIIQDMPGEAKVLLMPYREIRI